MASNNQINTPIPFAIAIGGTGVTSVTTAPAASSWAGWDANKNMSADSFLAGYTTTATAAGTTTLTVDSTQQQFFTGATTQTVVLPVTSTLVLGQSYYIVNNSSGVVTVQSSGANSVQAMAANTSLLVTCILTSGTTAASWSVDYNISGGGGGADFPVNTNITSMTGLTGTLKYPTGIVDSNGNLIMQFSFAASAVNYFRFYNSATGTPTLLYAEGSDAAIPILIGAKNSNVYLLDPTNTIAPALRFYNAAGTKYTGFKVATAQATDLTLTLPAADGSVSGSGMVTNASGVLSFTASPVITQVNVQRITATGAFTYTKTTGTVYAIFELQAGGGGSGGTTGAGGQGACSGSGGGGAYMRVLVTGSANLAAITGSVGIAGTAGSSGNNNGGTGGSTTLVINGGSTWTAAGGALGAGQASSASAQNGGAPGAGGTNTAGTNGTLIQDLPGGTGSYGGVSASGAGLSVFPMGGKSFLGAGGAANGAGQKYGGGAAGFVNITGSNQAGVAGGIGIVVVTEFISA